jgi:L-alanine-DL-glutamate epimerase-like enolase superfamily enzyme
MSAVRVTSLDCCIVSLPRDVPYLGPLRDGERVNAQGYFVRKGNRTVYPATDLSVVVKASAADGTVGWGETYGVAAPEATVAIIERLLAPFVIGRDARDAAAIWQDLYDLQRVRGASAGYFGDALAGIDIALCDLAARSARASLAQWLGEAGATRIPAYVSGLPRATLAERVALAHDLVAQGYKAVKFAAPVATEGVIEEMRALREALGDAVDIMVDLHWRYDAETAVGVVEELLPYRPRFAEAPCAPEDVAGLATVAARAKVPIAAGEEWHNVYEADWRLDTAPLGVIQPEIAHTGVTQFMAIARRAVDRGAAVMPHATIGVGIFMAASLHATAALGGVPYHEYQHSVFDRNLRYVDTNMTCAEGYYRVPDGHGHGATPRAELWNFVRR